MRERWERIGISEEPAALELHTARAFPSSDADPDEPGEADFHIDGVPAGIRTLNGKILVVRTVSVILVRI